MSKSSHQLSELLLREISAAGMKSGDKLPTEDELSSRFKTNRSAVHRAVKKLEMAGIVRRWKNRGTFISDNLSSEDCFRLKCDLSNFLYIVADVSHSDNIHWTSGTLAETEKILNARGKKAVFKNLPRDRDSLAALLHEIAGSGPAGILFVTSGLDINFLMENQGVILAHYPNPDEVYILSLEHAPADDFFFNILSSDPLAEGFMAGEHLMKKGWSRILCPLQDELSHTKNWVVQRLRGVKHAVDAGNGKAGYELIKGSSKNGELFEKITSLIKGSSERIGVAALTDELAAGILDFAEKHNLRAGKDYGLISFDDNPRYRSYNLTTVAPPRGKISSALADMMTDRKNTDGRIILKLKSTVIERTSC